MTPSGHEPRVEHLCQEGKALLDARRFAEAEAKFSRAREVSPEHPEVYYCFGLLFADLGRPAEALAAFDRALALDNSHAKAHNNRGSALQQMNRLTEAEAAYRRALDLAPDAVQPYLNLANVVDQQFRTAEALKVYDLALSRGLDPEIFAQYRSSLLGKASAPRSPDNWVRTTFDNFAPTFDDHLRGLRYIVPQAFAEMLSNRTKPGDRLLDIGCGTGQVGAALDGLGLRMTGVDLSEKMLVQARERGIYQDLYASEVHAYLMASHAASFDIVCAADVFIYIGDLQGLFASVSRVLRRGGWFLFSIEESSAADYTLLNTGRYAQSRAYIRRLAGLRFATVEDRPGAIRMERGNPLHGRALLLQSL